MKTYQFKIYGNSTIYTATLEKAPTEVKMRNSRTFRRVVKIYKRYQKNAVDVANVGTPC